MTDDELIEWAAKLDTDTCKAFYVFRMAKAMSLTFKSGNAEVSMYSNDKCS